MTKLKIITVSADILVSSCEEIMIKLSFQDTSYNTQMGIFIIQMSYFYSQNNYNFRALLVGVRAVRVR